MYGGWYQLAFERELQVPVTPGRIGALPLILVRGPAGLRAFDAVCPHRGAHLGFGGQIDGDAIICPFHGRRIGLGDTSACSLQVREYPTLALGGLVFALLGEGHDHGFRETLTAIDRSHFFVQGFTVTARTRPEIVIENGFDPSHFKAVHGLRGTPDLNLVHGDHGELVVEGTFVTPFFQNVWNASGGNIRFVARVFSPSVCLTSLCCKNGEYVVISAATPIDDERCVIRVSLAMPPKANGQQPDGEIVRALLRDSKLAYEQDIVIWENLFPDAPCQLDAEDELVSTYRAFCTSFLDVWSHD
jgi:phenylpropionate dioxygenase-like ring-hydroxylating dioxygenase large terminal subunit